MSFFDSIPLPPPATARPRRLPWTPPDAVIPGSVPADLMLIRTEQVAVAVGSVRAYPAGFEFTLHIRLRHQDESRHGGADPLQPRVPWRDRQVPGEVLRLGLMYADGRRTATHAAHALGDDDTDPERLIMVECGSHGSPRRWDGDFWVHPLPPQGPVTFVASWPRYGVAETRMELDGAVIRDAAGRAATLWPEQPGA